MNSSTEYEIWLENKVSDLMPKMINTKYGYVTSQEAEMDAHLDKWMKRRRANKHGAFCLTKTRKLMQRKHK